MARFLSLTGTVFALLFVSIAPTLQAQAITTFDAPNSTNTMPFAINLEGQITGTGDSQGFLRQPNGTFLTFAVEDSGPPPNAYPMSINSEGDIVGNFFVEINSVGFLRKPGGKTIGILPPIPNEASTQKFPQAFPQELPSFGCPPFGESEAVAVNDVGQITGYFNGAGCDGFLRQPNGTFITFSVPSESHPNGFPVAQPQAINLFGQITGYYGEDAVVIQIGGFLRQQSGNVIRFFAPNSIATFPTSINFFGQIAGFYQDTNNVVHGFLRQPDGTMVTFDPAGSTDTEAYSINALGEITGFYLGADGIHHGFLRKQNGTFTMFDVPNSQGTFARSINFFGQVTGYYFDGSSYHGFIRPGRFPLFGGF